MIVLLAVLAIASPVLDFVDLTGPLYQDQTPLCHYVERGIDDLQVGKRDVHVVAVPAIESLAQVDHLTLGLDLPYTRCKDNPRSHPCADEDHTTDWRVEKVELWVGDTKLFERSEPGGCALRVGGGLDGMRTITRTQCASSTPVPPGRSTPGARNQGASPWAATPIPIGRAPGSRASRRPAARGA